MNFTGAIFDLDGVLVDTAKYHYLAWKDLADQLGIIFTEKHNESLKGVSRMTSLEILLKINGSSEAISIEEKETLANEKNKKYISYINRLDASELLPGALDLLKKLKEGGIKIALGSASKNALLILEKTGIITYFDAIVDGNHVKKAKPDPEVFLLGAKKLKIAPEKCIVFEDSQAGLEAAKATGMYAVGIGISPSLLAADELLNGLDEIEVDKYFGKEISFNNNC